MCSHLQRKQVQSLLSCINIMKSIAKDQDIEEGELPDDDSPPHDSSNPPAKTTQNYQLKEKQTSDRSLRKLGEEDESSAQIIFQTVPQKNYRDSEFSPEKKKKKIQKVEVKVKTKDKSNDRSSYERQKKTQKRVNTTQSNNINQGSGNSALDKEEAPSYGREYQQNNHFPNSYMYMNPMGQFMPQMYPNPNAQFGMPYMHPPQFPMAAPLPNMAMGHLPYPMMPQQMYPVAMPMKQYPAKQPERPDKYKYEGMKVGNMPQYAPPMVHTHQNNPYPPNNSNINSFRGQEKFIPPPTPYQPTHYANPSYSSYKPPSQPQRYTERQERVEKQERPKQKPQAPQQYQQYQAPKDKRKEFIESLKRQAKKSMKELEVGQQQQILQTVSSQASQTLFPPQSKFPNQPQSTYQKNLSKLSRLISQSMQKSQLINRLLLTLQMKDLVLRLRERKLFSKLITPQQSQVARRMRNQLDLLSQQ